MGLRTKHSGDHALIILRWRYGLSTNHRFGHLLQPGFFYANLQSSPVRKWKTVLSFSKARRAVFCTGLDARALIQGLGLTVVDQGHPRAALDVNDLWIPDVGAQHPVESYGQLARRCHFGHSFGLAVATVLILFTKSLVQAHYRVRRFHQRLPQKAIALFGNRPQPLPTTGTVLARNQPQVAGHLLAARETADVADGEHKRQRGYRTHARLRQQQAGLRV